MSDKVEVASALTHHEITVLLIDDQAMVAEAVRRMLADEKDIVFHYCQDPTRAVQVANEIRPTVILQDLIMGEVHGLTLVKFFRANPATRETPLIVLSTREEATTKAEAFTLGANDYLVKLPDKVELIARIRYHSQAYIALLQRNEAFEAIVRNQRALEEQLARASEYVISLLPGPVDQKDVATDWRFVPSAQLGGDSLGYHWVDEDHFAVYLLDVCDHGVGPALLSVQALNALRSEALPGVDFREPKQVLTGLNDSFQMEKHNDLYFTIWYGVYRKSDRTLFYGSGGHPPCLLVPDGGEALELRTPNLMIGGMPDLDFKIDSVAVPRPADLYLYSDGVYEVTLKDGSMWSFAEFKSFLLSRSKESGGEMDALYEHVLSLHGGESAEDDFSLLKVRFR